MPDRQQQAVTPDQDTALQRLAVWRQLDKAAIAAKLDQRAQRAEYASRKKLRAAADKLGGGEP